MTSSKPTKAGSFHSQEGKDEFEYSVFGSPRQKIGNFTQQKLTCFGGN
jgi:hypothetical protein